MKRRIFFGIAPILLLVAAIGIYAIVLFRSLGSKIDLLLKEADRLMTLVEEFQRKKAAAVNLRDG